MVGSWINHKKNWYLNLGDLQDLLMLKTCCLFKGLAAGTMSGACMTLFPDELVVWVGLKNPHIYIYTYLYIYIYNIYLHIYIYK